MGDLSTWAMEKARAIGNRRLSKLRKLDRETVEWVENDIARVLADEREACCKAVCFQCARGDHPARQREDNGAWVHVGRGWVETCKAQAIREREVSLAPAPASAPEKAD